MKRVVLKKATEKFVHSFHPWIYQQAIKTADPNIEPGEIVYITNSNNQFIAYGFYNPHSAIALRILELHESNIPDEAWFYKKIAEAISRRKNILSSATNSCRLVFGESYFLPGLIVDKYADFLVIQIHTAGVERFKQHIINYLTELSKPTGIIEKNDSDIRTLEQLTITESHTHGKKIPESFIITENTFRYKIFLGQKTGFYCDQRENRKAVSALSSGKKVLDCFSYTGSFALHCLKNKAQHVLRIDSSKDALAIGDENIKLNGFSLENSPSLVGNAFEVLRKFRDENKRFDMIILDPPKLASRKQEKDKALRAYKDINLLAIKLLNTDGILATFSCSGGVNREDFRMALAWAAKDAERKMSIIQTLGQPEDHPINIYFPESEYLKGFICRVL